MTYFFVDVAFGHGSCDLTGVLQRAYSAGVDTLVALAGDSEEMRVTLEIVRYCL
jgi:hypothetical protein